MVVDWLIRRAKRTPYFHLQCGDGSAYMERYWLVPYQDSGEPGCGPVAFWRRPIAWLLQQLGIAVRIHCILKSDDGRTWHDHPWNFLTIILRGGYYEYTPGRCWLLDFRISEVIWRGPGSVLFRRATSFHRLGVSGRRCCWTLFITGPKRNEWGFTETGWRRDKVPWREYLQRQQIMSKR